MKKLLGMTALLCALSPFAQAQNNMNNGLSDHPNARNDRSMESHAMHKNMKHHHKATKHHRRHRHHHHAHGAK